ncbi:Na/Pi cotransporter family protein [Mycoplasmopsis cynos]|uniref:Na/Pi cotransporter II-related protein n=1 Tax=Mycoplasmopsis cynos (strain C142) TaxID=1246955 RepID=L0RYH3_MYCC1|nr:Na/Pi symporter [Mycoplasmopsis cynos]MCU9932720.1 Na/Pi symporter [Mycoplasmopsis cynos]WQQ13044.1 Na/Pi symporter [Mycoplasmopsis cynos]WQQ14146.1 Na/Pi symporter [Mycoplasmopsis cynos]WQQ14653.1 Na/Pi symporter [Mycoplasmopsis cynos]WQQ15112.1 Na/Pi symporter [Mycoplasmopsis cynos]
MNFSSISLAIIFALASLALFIFSTKKLSSSLKSLGDTKFKKILNFISKNNFMALIIGVFITTLIQSSDGAVALIMGLLAARFISLKVAIAFLLGANIGTATTSLIVSFQSSFAFTEYFILLMFIGVFGWILTKRTNWINIFLIILSIGMIFFSLKILSSSAVAIVKTDLFKKSIGAVGINPWLAFIFSFALTGILQSSSATVTLYQIVYAQSDNILPTNSAIALVLGSNVGTTITGLVVSFTSKNKNSQKIAIIWGITNLSISLLVLPFLYPLNFFETLITSIVDNSNKTLQLSIAHLLFNFILVGIYIWLIKYLEILVNKIIKDDNLTTNYQIILPYELINQNAFLALKSAKKALQEQARISKSGLMILEKYLNTGNYKLIDKYEELSNIIDETRRNIYNYLIKITSNNLSTEEAKIHLSLVLSSRSVDKIMTIGSRVILELKKVNDPKKPQKFILDNELILEIKNLLNITSKILDNVIFQLEEFSHERSIYINELKDDANNLSLEYAKTNIYRLKTNLSQKQLEFDFDYSRLLRAIERIIHHCQRIDQYIANEAIKIKINEPIELNYYDSI